MNNWTKRVLLVLQTGGGFVGLVVIAQSLATAEITPVLFTVCVVFAGLFSLGIVAGLALVEKPHLGLRLSMIYQVLQVPMLVSPVVTYVLTSGLMVGVGLQVVMGQPKVGANYYLGSQFQFRLFEDMPWYLGINIVAVVLLAAVAKAIGQETEQGDRESLSESAPSGELS